MKHISLFVSIFSILLAVRCEALEPGEQVWFFPTGAPVVSSPAIDGNGNILFGSEDSFAYSVRPDLSVNWAVQAGDLITGNVAIGPGGRVVFGSWDGKIYSVGPDGSTDWSYDTKSFVSASPAVSADGTVYIGARDGVFHALSRDGELLWFHVAEGPILGGAAIGPDGTLYFGDEGGVLHALYPDGRLKWQFTAESIDGRNSRIRSSPAIDRKGTLYFGSGNHWIYALYPTGEVKWSYETGDKNDSSPVIDSEGHVIVASRDGFLYKFKPVSGLPVWAKLVGDVFYASPAIDSEDNIYIPAYVGSGITRLFAVGADSSVLWTRNYSGLNDSSPVLSEDGYLYIGFHDGNLYKVFAGNGPAASIWPTIGRTATRTANLDEVFATAEIAGEWLFSDWFGWLSLGTASWIYHLEHQWLFAPSNSAASYWYFDLGIGSWCWTSSSYYPLVYSSDEGWLLYLSGSISPVRWFYSYSRQEWASEAELAVGG
jgi:outer membrane protein assembly factor BamB